MAFIAHMKAPARHHHRRRPRPASPRQLATLEVPPGTHSHKVRAGNGLMLVNREGHGAGASGPGGAGGLGIYDVSKPAAPRELAFWRCGGLGVHRFTFDGRYAYISPEMDGYVGNIVMILDLADPRGPRRSAAGGCPASGRRGGETPTWKGRQHRCHHPMRLGNRLYVSYWHGGFVILDIEDMAQAALRLRARLEPAVPHADAHRAAGAVSPPRPRVMLVADEDVAKLEPGPPSFLWLVDITDETRPVPFASFQVEGIDGEPQPEFTGCHQPCEMVTGTEIPVAWFAHGLRIVDIANPHAPREVAHFLPRGRPRATTRVCSNDVCVDDRGLIYLIDRGRGLHILERV